MKQASPPRRKTASNASHNVEAVSDSRQLSFEILSVDAIAPPSVPPAVPKRSGHLGALESMVKDHNLRLM